MGAPEQITTPIFRSVYQALHVAFLMEILPVRERGHLDRMTEMLMRDAGIMPAREPHIGTINFAGLSAIEVRGQCAMIRAAVRDRLPIHLACAVWARWGHQTTKSAGVRGLIEYCGPLLSVGDSAARLAMGWAIFGTEIQRRGITGAEIAREWALNGRAVQRDIVTIKRAARAAQEAATDALDGIFRRDGVC